VLGIALLSEEGSVIAFFAMTRGVVPKPLCCRIPLWKPPAVRALLLTQEENFNPFPMLYCPAIHSRSFATLAGDPENMSVGKVR